MYACFCEVNTTSSCSFCLPLCLSARRPPPLYGGPSWTTTTTTVNLIRNNYVFFHYTTIIHCHIIRVAFCLQRNVHGMRVLFSLQIASSVWVCVVCVSLSCSILVVVSLNVICIIRAIYTYMVDRAQLLIDPTFKNLQKQSINQSPAFLSTSCPRHFAILLAQHSHSFHTAVSPSDSISRSPLSLSDSSCGWPALSKPPPNHKTTYSVCVFTRFTSQCMYVCGLLHM